MDGKNLVGISDSVGITPSQLSPAHQELDWDLPLKAAGHTTSSVTKRAFDRCLDFRGRLGSRAKGSSMAGHHVAGKPRHVIQSILRAS